MNLTYFDLLNHKRQYVEYIDLPTLCDWVKLQYAALRGAFVNTQMEGEGYDFFHLGCYIEKSDSTARLLNMKYYVLALPDALAQKEQKTQPVDEYQWAVILRAVSSWRLFHRYYGSQYVPSKVGHFLILNHYCPWSLLHCSKKIESHLNNLGQIHGDKASLKRLSDNQLDLLNATSIEQIIISGLHEFLGDYITRVIELDQQINDIYFLSHAQ